MGARVTAPVVATAEVAAAPAAGPATGKANGSIIVATGTGDVWIVRSGNWVDSAVDITPVPAKVGIVQADPVATPPPTTWATNDIVFWDDTAAPTAYKTYVRTATPAWVAAPSDNVTK